MSADEVDDTGPGISRTPEAGSALGGLAARRQVRLGGLVLSGRRRRPSGEKPPLPRDLDRSGRIWLVVGVLTAALWISLFATF